MRNDWRGQLFRHIGALGAFRSADIVDFGLSIDVSKRSIDAELQMLASENLIIKIRQGLYVTSELATDRANALIAIGNTFQVNGVASLDTAFFTDPDRAIHIVVPAGKVGRLKTPIGDLHVHAITRNLTTALIDTLGRDAVYAVDPTISTPRAQHTPELSICLAAYLVNCGRSEYRPNKPVVLDQLDINQKRLDSIMKVTGVPMDHIEILAKPIPSLSVRKGADPSPSI